MKTILNILAGSALALGLTTPVQPQINNRVYSTISQEEALRSPYTEEERFGQVISGTVESATKDSMIVKMPSGICSIQRGDIPQLQWNLLQRRIGQDVVVYSSKYGRHTAKADFIAFSNYAIR